MKKVKYAKPAMQHIQTVVGGADQLKAMVVKSYNFAKQKAAAEAGAGDNPEEESKQGAEEVAAEE